MSNPQTQQNTPNLKTQVIMDKIAKQAKMYPTELRDHSGPVNRVILNRPNTLFATCSNDNLVNIYNAVTFELINQFKTKEAIKKICFTDKGDRIIVSSLLDPWYVFNVFAFQDEQKPFHFMDQNVKIVDFALSYGDKYLAFIYRAFNVSKSATDKATNRVVIYDYEALIAGHNDRQSVNKCLVEVAEMKAPKGINFTNVLFGLKEETLFVTDLNNVIYKYDLTNPTEPKIAIQTQLESVGTINSLTFSPKFEFLLSNCQNGLVMLDPENLKEFRFFKTKHPVLCGQVSPLLYSSNPKFHVIFAGGIAARDQALAAEGGNEVFVYNFAVGQKLTELSGCFGNINWLAVFKDGSGFLTAGEEAIVRIYRFDKSYYVREEETEVIKEEKK